MPVGTPKVTLFGGVALVPGGCQVFNSPGTFKAPTGVSKVNITGNGGTGSAGNSGSIGNTGGGGGGGGGGGAIINCCCDCFWSGLNAGAGAPSLGGANGGTAPGNAGNPGNSGISGNAGSPGNAGASGNSSSGICKTFPGGAGGNGGAGGSGGPSGGGGNGGAMSFRPGYKNSGPAPCWPAWWQYGGNCAANNMPAVGIGGSPGGGGSCCKNRTPFSYSYRNPGGGGAGDTNDGSRYCQGNPGGGRGGYISTPCTTKGVSSNNPRAGAGGGSGRYSNGRPYGPFIPAPPCCGGPYQIQANLFGAGAGGGGRGSTGSPGSAGNPGSSATPASYNCLSVTPGGSYPITVGSPGGQVKISWNPQ